MTPHEVYVAKGTYGGITGTVTRLWILRRGHLAKKSTQIHITVTCNYISIQLEVPRVRMQ